MGVLVVLSIAGSFPWDVTVVVALLAVLYGLGFHRFAHLPYETVRSFVTSDQDRSRTSEGEGDNRRYGGQHEEARQ